MNYVIGVDGGGTKTQAIAYDLEGNEISEAVTGFGNLVNGKEEALKNIIDSINLVISKVPDGKLQAIYLGIAGSEVCDNSDLIYKRIKDVIGIESTVMNDSYLALKAMLKGEDGILTIAGTGSISFGINNGTQKRAGGWGHLLGDEGSGYKIAIEALKEMINQKDNENQLSELSKAILKELKIENVDEIVSFVYTSTKDEIASLTKVVSRLAEDGNLNAINIIEREGIALAKTTENVFKNLNFKECSIGLVGGVIKKSTIMRNAFEGYLRENINIKSFVDYDISPAKGAYYIYLKDHL